MNKELSKVIGNRIRMRRKSLGWKIKTLAEKSGISKELISRYELGKYNLSVAKLFQIADALDTRIHWFFMDCYLYSDNNVHKKTMNDDNSGFAIDIHLKRRRS